MSESIPKTTLAGRVYLGSDVNEELSPIILLHALLSSKEIWENIAPEIANATNRKAYAYDSRDHGANEHTANFDLDSGVEDLFVFMEEIGADKAILVGHTTGGIIATQAALKMPDKIEKVVVVEVHINQSKVIQQLGNVLIEYKNIIDGLNEFPSLDPVETTAESSNNQEALPSNQEQLNKKLACLESVLKVRDEDMKYSTVGMVKFLQNYQIFEDMYYYGLKVESEVLYNNPAFFIFASHIKEKVEPEKEIIKKKLLRAEFVEIVSETHLVFNKEPTKFTEDIVKCLLK